MNEPTPGRSCPLHYRYSPQVFATPAPADLRHLDTLYVVGGLYGNELALNRVLDLFAQETGQKQLVFNGDFHWFDADPALFDRVQRAVLGHVALRGNVETELATDNTNSRDAGADTDAGCGCAYPDWVGDDVVLRSNRILSRLRQAVTPAQRTALAALPMWLRADVGPLRLGIVHGDAQSLAGWGFAQEHLRSAAHRSQVQGWFQQAQVHAFACTHTCLPVFQALGQAPGARQWVFNNGAAGMPNFSGDTAGLLTRISRTPAPESLRRFGVRVDTAGEAIFVDALAVQTDTQQALQRFAQLWPPGSDAHASYINRIQAGPAYSVAEAVRSEG